MALPNWTNAQVIDQLDSGFEWDGAFITYSFPSVSSLMFGDGTEATGFVAADPGSREMFRLAIRAWDDLMAPNFVEVFAGTSDIEMAFSSTGVDYAHTYFPDIGSAWFSTHHASGVNDLTAPPVGSYGFNTYLHELGHALGLDHMGDYNGDAFEPSSRQDSAVFSIMSYFGPNGPVFDPEVEGADWDASNHDEYDPQTPMLSDILAVQAMYGASTTTRTDNTTYGFNCSIIGGVEAIFDFTLNQHPVLAIWDSAGIDTLDLSGFTTASTISLVAGTFSHADGMTKNISIAYNCVIENAVGGIGNDNITGNTAANLLQGGDGNDIITADSGDDTLAGGAGNDALTGGAGNDRVIFSGNFASYSFAYDAHMETLLVTSTPTNSDIVHGVEFFQFADVTRTAAQLIQLDVVAPTLTSTLPADGQLQVPTSSNFVFSFSEIVHAGSGNIVFHNANGSVARSIAIGDTSQVTISANAVIVNPSVDLAFNNSFYVTIDAGALLDAADNPFAGLSDPSAFNFSTTSDDYPFNATTTGVVPVGGSANGVINAAGDMDMLKVTLSAGQTYVFDLRATPDGLSNPSLLLYSPLLDGLTSNDNGGGGLDARIVHTAATSGAFHLGAQDATTGIGAYTLSAALANVVTGGAGAETLTGGAALDVIRGNAGNDTLRGNAGDDQLEGGAGIDMAVYAGAGAGYLLTVGDSTVRLANPSGGDGTDILTGVERLQFADGKLALDVSGNAGMVAKIIGAVFGASFVHDMPYYMGTGLFYADGGMAALELSGLAAQVQFGAGTDAQLVQGLYQNVAGSPAAQGDVDFFVGLLQSGVHTRASLTLFAAEHAANAANIGLSGLTATGIDYL